MTSENGMEVHFGTEPQLGLTVMIMLLFVYQAWELWCLQCGQVINATSLR